MAVLTGRRVRPLLPWLCAALVIARSLAAQTPGSLETDVKAAFLYNFAKYVSWPPAVFPPPDRPFRICVVADAAFGRAIDSIIEGETIEGRPAQRVTPTAEDIRGCHILFVSAGELQRSAGLLQQVRSDPVLTVSDSPDALARGYAIALVRDGGRIRFDVNLTEAQRSGLMVSSRLLRVARRVDTIAPGPRS